MRVQRGGRLVPHIAGRAGEHGMGTGGMEEEQFLVAEQEAVLVVEWHREADTLAISKTAVPASQVDQRQVARIFALNQGVQPGNRTAIQHYGAAIAPADCPGLALAKQIPAVGRHRQQIRAWSFGTHVQFNLAELPES